MGGTSRATLPFLPETHVFSTLFKLLQANSTLFKHLWLVTLLTRKVYAEVPPRVEYTLTELGRSLRPVLASMAEWGSKYQRENR